MLSWSPRRCREGCAPRCWASGAARGRPSGLGGMGCARRSPCRSSRTAGQGHDDDAVHWGHPAAREHQDPARQLHGTGRHRAGHRRGTPGAAAARRRAGHAARGGHAGRPGGRTARRVRRGLRGDRPSHRRRERQPGPVHPDGCNFTLAGWSQRGTHVPPGTRLPLDGDSVSALVQQTQAPGRVDCYEALPGRLAARLRELGIRSEVGAPVSVDGGVWGALIAGTHHPEPLAPGAEWRLAGFAELIGTAVSNAAARSELIASRARIVTASDAARQRVTRDLHDGAQQQFVNTIIDLQLAQQKWSSAPAEARELVARALAEAQAGLGGLRELSAGIHPAILTHRGLAAALDALAARLPISVELDVTGRRLPEAIEGSIYFFCSEALTNVVKHARASSARVRVARQHDQCTIEVRDDGIGRPEPRSETSGLTGLHDRIGALKGAMQITSPASSGTTLRAWIPLSANRAASETERNA